jgi:hypothetical protein
MRIRLLLAIVLGIASVVAGQQSQQTTTHKSTPSAEQASEADVQLMREDIRAERKRIVAANLPLTATEATKFWPVYDQYIADVTKINDGRYALIKEYAQTRDTMTDAQANDLIKGWLAFDGDTTNLRLKYVPQLEKVISAKKTAIFYQIDHRLDMLIQLQFASQIPLVKP